MDGVRRIRNLKTQDPPRTPTNGSLGSPFEKGSCLSTPSQCCSPDRWQRLRNRRACPGEAYEPTDIEHFANIVTHAISILPAVGAMAYLLYFSISATQAVAGFIYGLSLIALFGMSTAFHCACYWRFSGRVKFILHICDRATIFIFTASSYTPWLLLKESDPYVFAVLLGMWIMVMGGIQYQLRFHERYKHFETFLYLVIGILPAVLSVPGMKDGAGLWRAAEGGAIYVLGIVFFKADGVIPFAHAIWHVFVVVGAGLQFSAVAAHLYPSHPVPLAGQFSPGYQ